MSHFLTITQLHNPGGSVPSTPFTASTPTASIRNLFSLNTTLYLAQLNTAEALFHLKECAETGIEMVNTHNKTHGASETWDGKDWCMLVVGAMEDAGFITSDSAARANAVPR